MAGKGDSPRNCFTKAYLENYDLIFRKTLDVKEEASKTSKRDDKNKSTERGLRNRTRASRDVARGMDVPI
jgi:hypothetical protein